MNEILIKITNLIDTYNSGAWLTLDNLRTMRRELASNYYYLTKFNIEAYKEWNAIIFKRDLKESVAAATSKADSKVPELRMTRKILEAVKLTLDSMQQEISIMNKEIK